MIQITFTTNAVKELEYELFHYPHPKVQQRILVLLLKSHKLPHGKICEICNITEKTLTNYLKRYLKNGINSLKELGCKGKTCELNKHKESLEKYFTENPIRSSNEAKKIIEEKTGISRSLTQVRDFLNRIGLKYLKVGCVPGKAATEEKIAEQENYIVNELNPAIEDAKKGNSATFFWMRLISCTEPS